MVRLSLMKKRVSRVGEVMFHDTTKKTSSLQRFALVELTRGGIILVDSELQGGDAAVEETFPFHRVFSA